MLTPFVNHSSMTNSQPSYDSGEDTEIENTKEAIMVLNDKIEKDFEGNSLQAFVDYNCRQSQVVFILFQNKVYLKYKLTPISRK